MKKREFEKISANPEEIEKTLKDIRSQLSKEMSKRATGGAPTKPSTIKNLKRMIARLLTTLSSRNIQAKKAKDNKGAKAGVKTN